MRKVLLFVCMAWLAVLVSSARHSAQATSSSYSYAASSTSACGGGCSKPAPKCNNPNEVFDLCPATCPPQQCGVDPALILCAPSPKYGDPACRPGCRCIDDYVRNENNECIPKDSCPNQGCNGDPNATPGCGINCGRTCATYDQVPQSCIQVCKENGCDCKKDYVFDDSQGRCVLPQDCSCNGDPNATPGCGVNCGRTCATYNSSEPQSCIAICYENACDCKKNYVFDDGQGRCVLPQDCTTPGCNGDPNATPGCGVNCGRTCATYNSSEPQFCPAICYENACDCKKDFVFDNSQGRCVLPQDCTRTSCGGDPNAKPGCGVNCGRTCSTYRAKNPICPRICKRNGCDCKSGYVFDPNVNRCVRPGQCSSSQMRG